MQKRPADFTSCDFDLCSMIALSFLHKPGSLEPPKMPPKYWPFWYPGVFFKSHLFGPDNFLVSESRVRGRSGDWPETLMVFFQKKIC